MTLAALLEAARVHRALNSTNGGTDPRRQTARVTVEVIPNPEDSAKAPLYRVAVDGLSVERSPAASIDRAVADEAERVVTAVADLEAEAREIAERRAVALAAVRGSAA